MTASGGHGGRILAIDHGAARSGCAVCDPSGTIVRPLTPVEPTDVVELARLARDEGATEIVLGLPLSLTGDEGSQAEVVRAFGAELSLLLENVGITYFDERFTTRQAQASARAGAGSAEDSLAAAHLLEAYLETRAVVPR